VKKILIIKHGSLGDIVFALPALASIRATYIEAKIYLLTENKYINFFNRWNIFDFLLSDNRKENFFKSLNKLFKLRNIQFDLIIDLQNSQRTSLYNLFFRIFYSAKICSSRPFAHYRYYIQPQGSETAITGLFNQLRLIGIKEIDNQSYHWLKVKIKENYNKPLALIIPGVSKGADYKQWQPEKFAEIAKYCELKNYRICVVGSTTDSFSAEPILHKCKNVLNKINLSPPEIIYSIALKSTLIFSNDTGPGHIASLANNHIIWIINDNNISKANIINNEINHKILSNSVKNISSEEVIKYIEKNKLLNISD